MSALRRVATTAPRFTTYTDVEVDIEPDELERAGWVFVGKDADPPREAAVDAVRRYHDVAHDTSWRFCQIEPCYSLNREPVG
jgi:hypothetical protein